MYLDWFMFPDGEQEVDFFYGIQRTCYDSYYPFRVLSKRKFCRIDFEPVTILYGGERLRKDDGVECHRGKTGAFA